MKRVVVVVEGQTERSFVNSVLAEAFWSYQVYLTPILLGHKGGGPTYARVKKDVLPGLPVPSHFSNIAKIPAGS